MVFIKVETLCKNDSLEDYFYKREKTVKVIRKGRNKTKEKLNKFYDKPVEEVKNNSLEDYFYKREKTVKIIRKGKEITY